MNSEHSSDSTVNDITRRQMLRHGGLALFGAALPGIAGAAERTKAGKRGRPASADGDGDDDPVEAAAATANLVKQNRSPRSVQEYYVRRVREVMREADARRAALRTKADAERYAADVRARLRECYGLMPGKRRSTPALWSWTNTFQHPTQNHKKSSERKDAIDSTQIPPPTRGPTPCAGHLDRWLRAPCRQLLLRSCQRQHEQFRHIGLAVEHARSRVREWKNLRLGRCHLPSRRISRIADGDRHSRQRQRHDSSPERPQSQAEEAHV